MRIITQSWSLGALLLPALLLTATPAAQLAGQPAATLDRPVAFQHGFLSDGSVWSTAMATLRANLRIHPAATTTVWYDPIRSQAASLPAMLNTLFGSDSNRKVAYVAHSQGGVVVRALSRISTRSDALVSIASPHLGANIAANFYYGGVQQWVRYLTGAIADPIRYYTAYDPDFRDPYSNGNIRDLGYFQLLYSAAALVQSRFCTEAGFCEYAAGQLVPAILDEIPGSNFHQYLSQTAATEQQRLKQRVSIRVMDSPYNVMWKMLFGGQQYARGFGYVRAYVWAQSINEWLRYNNSPDYLLDAGSDLWLFTAQAVGDMDADWAALCGGLQGYYRPTPFLPEPILTTNFDGFISGSSQVMNGSNRVLDAIGMYHTQATTLGVPAIQQALLENVAMSPRPVGSVASVTVTPGSGAVSVGSSLQLAAAAYSVQWAPLSGRTFTWTSRNPAIATVSAQGVVSGQTPGTAIIEVVSEGYGSLATLTVQPGAPLTGVSITGPSTVTPGEYPTFTASAAGGVAPVQFQWKVDGQTRQSGSANTFNWMSGTSYTVEVVVTDALGASRSASKPVQVQCGAICQP